MHGPIQTTLTGTHGEEEEVVLAEEEALRAITNACRRPLLP